MKVNPLVAVILLGLPASFAAGWFLKPVPAGDPTGPGNRTRTISGPGGNPTAAPGTSTVSLGSTPRVEIKPLTGLQDILDALGPDMNTRNDKRVVLAMMELVPRLMLTDIGVVRTMLGELENNNPLGGDFKKVVSVGLVLRWMVEQPEAALGYSLERPHLLEDADDLSTMGLMFLAKSRPQAAQALVSRIPESRREEVQQMLALTAAMADPGKTLQDPGLTAKLDARARRELAALWMQGDPAAAKAWLDGLPPDQREPGLVAALAAIRMKQDATSTLAWLGSLPDGPERNACRTQIITENFEGIRDQAALETKLGQFPSDWHDAIRLRWLGEGHVSDGKAAAGQLKDLLVRNPTLAEDRSAIDIARRASEDYAKNEGFTEGSQWVLSLPPGDAQAAAAANLIGSWTGKDPEAASSWVSQLPAGPARDRAATTLIKKIQQEDPEAAIAWAQSLGDEVKRRQTTQGVFTEWFNRAPLEAVAAIHELSPADRQRLLGK